MNSDELLRINSLKPILLKFRLLEKLTTKGKNNFWILYVSFFTLSKNKSVIDILKFSYY
jgi:hypothetical protein